jgi:putative molybdopterin biosynthesis protein
MEMGKIIESNSRVFEGIVRQCGGEPVRLEPVADDYALLLETVGRTAAENDVLIIIAGSSAGTEDYTSKLVAQLGEVYVHGLAIKPGKPAILGKIGNTPVIGVPGYPVSAWVVFDAIVKPLLFSLQHQRPVARNTTEAILSRRMVSSLKHLEVVRVKLGKVGDRLIATPLSRGAGVTMSLVRADGLLNIPQNSEGIEAGTRVNVELLRPLSEIENTVVVIGSHDLVIDLLADQMHTLWPDAGLSSAHVGSMAGVMAVARGEAHIAPIHLLDEGTGLYNSTYVKRILPEFEGVLIRGLKRTQGLMVQKGNPKGIKDLSDLTREDLRFVNRQKGSGTRLLLDFHLKNLNLNCDGIIGYEREMTTHMAVASAVASGTADAGLGILAAASLSGLDFIPVGEESYDFLIEKTHIDALPVRRFLEALQNKAFRQKVMTLGGYGFEGCGEVIQL